MALGDPEIVLNNVSLKVAPNSVSFREGYGEYKKIPQSAGNGRLSWVTSRDISTAMAGVELEVYSTQEAIQRLREAKANLDNNTITVNYEGESRTYSNAVIMDNYSIETGDEGTISVTIDGEADI